MRNCLTGCAPLYMKGLRVSQYLLHQVVPPFVLRLRATWLSLRSRLLWLNLGVLLLCFHPTVTIYLSPLETFFLYRLISSTGTWKPLSLSTKILPRSGAPLI